MFETLLVLQCLPFYKKKTFSLYLWLKYSSVSKCETFIFMSYLTHTEFRNSQWVSWDVFICMSSIRICSPYGRTQVETFCYQGFDARSYLRLTCTESDTTRQPWGTKVDFMDPMKLLGKIGLVLCLQGSRGLTREAKKVPSWQVQVPQKTLGTLKSEEFTQIFRFVGEVRWKVFDFALSLEAVKSSISNFLWKVPAKQI